MKLGTETHKVETFGVNNQTAFRIEAHSISFKILSDQLYSDKIGAVVRELSCNAFDAHVDGGKKDVPFRVHLPNTLEPWFSVRDWGIGLSDHDVKNLYTTYFGSTKRDSNDKVGCLGLGSKSPFAYTESFTVTSYHDGMKRTYTAFIGEEGIPMITRMGEEPTNDVNGLEVSLPVSPDDFREFADKAKIALCRFNPAPDVVGNKNFDLDSVEYWLEGKGWAIRKEESSRYGYRNRGESSVAVQGSVAYPIDINMLKDLTTEQRKLLDLPIDIYFELGELGITPSRESLSYSDGSKSTIDTIGNVIKRLDQVFAELPSKFEHEFNSCKTYWEACVLFEEMFSGGGGGASYAMAQLANSPSFDLKWNGKALKSHFKFEGSDVSGTFRMVKFERRRFGGRAQNLSADYIGNWSFRATNESKFFFDDIGRGAHTRLKNFDFPSDAKKVYLIKYEDPADLKLFIGFLGDVEVTAVSTLPKPVRQLTANSGNGHSPQCKVWLWDTEGNTKENWDQSKHKLRDGGIYVTLRRFKALNKAGSEVDLWNQHNQFKQAGLIDVSVPIYGLQPRNAKAVADNPKWITLEDHAKAELKTVLNSSALANKIANATAFSDFNWTGQFSNNEHWLTTSDNWNDLDDSSLFKTFIASYKYMSEESTDGLSFITRSAEALGCSVPEGAADYDLEGLWNSVLATYPMFEFLTTTSGYYGRNEITWNDVMLANLVQYIKGIDEAE